MDLVNLQSTFFNPLIGEETKGFAEFKKIKNFTYTYGYVLKGMEYRPDIVAGYYLGDPQKAWMITYANNFLNGIADYTLGKKLKIPSV